MRSVRPRAVLLALCAVVPAARLAAQDRLLEPRTVAVGAAERRYWLHAPGELPDGPRPLVVLLHGRGGSGRQAAAGYGWLPLAAREGFLVACPDALGRPRQWGPGYYRVGEHDDFAFLRAVLDDAAAAAAVDPSRVYLTGHSSGAIMSYAFAARHGDRLAAVAPVAGSIGVGRDRVEGRIDDPAVPVPVLAVHGLEDRVIPFDRAHGAGARYGFFIPAPESAAFFARRNGCAAEPARRELDGGSVLVDRWAPGPSGADVVLVTLVEHGHGWPTARRGGYDATAEIWAFFARHRRVPEPAAAGGEGK